MRLGYSLASLQRPWESLSWKGLPELCRSKKVTRKVPIRDRFDTHGLIELREGAAGTFFSPTQG